MKQNQGFSFKKRLRSFTYALRGLAALIKNEHNARIHLVAAILAVSCGIILRISTGEWLVIILVIGLVFSAELINSAVENLSDSLKPGFDEGIKRAKDYSAASVLVAAIISLISGLLIFLPKIACMVR